MLTALAAASAIARVHAGGDGQQRSRSDGTN